MSNTTDIDKHQPETEQVPWIGILTIIALVFGLCGGVFLGSLYGVRALVTKGKDKRSHIIGTQELNAIQKNEQQILNEYKKLANGKIRIPIARAMELLVSEAKGAAPVMPDTSPQKKSQAKTPVDSVKASSAAVPEAENDSAKAPSIAAPKDLEKPKKGTH